MVILKTAKEPLEDIVNETSKIDFLWLQMELVRGFDAQNPFHVVGVATLRVVFQLRRAVRSTLSMKVDNELGVELSIVIRQANPGSIFGASPTRNDAIHLLSGECSRVGCVRNSRLASLPSSMVAKGPLNVFTYSVSKLFG